MKLSWSSLLSARGTSSTASAENSNKQYKGNCPPELKAKIEYQFTSGGVDYFAFADEKDIPYTRFMAAIDIYQELELGVSPAVILQFCNALQSACTDPKVKTIEQMKQRVGVVEYQLRDRLEISSSIAIHMKLATVRYFDEHEDPCTFDLKYAAKKIRHWTENHDVQDFFFMLPIQKFMPPFEALQHNFQTFLKAEAIQNLSLIKSLLQLDTQNLSGDELKNTLEVQAAILEDIKSWAGSQSGNTAS